MPDNVNGPYTGWQQIARDLVNLLTMVIVAYTANVGNRNHERIAGVEQKQTEVVSKQDEAADLAAKVKRQLDLKAEEDNKATGVQLWGTYRYLDDVATSTTDPKDRAKAAEAKKAYDEFVKKTAATKP